MLHNADAITVLIPAAGRVPEGILGGVSTISSPALIPVARRPVIYWTLTHLRSLGLRRFQIAVPQRGLFLEDFVDCTIGRECDYGFIVPESGAKGGVGDTVLSLLETVQTKSALIVLGDTHFQFADPSILERGEPFVLTSAVDESYRWCIAEIDADKRITKLRNKVPNLPAPLEGLIGVYYFPDVELAKKAAKHAAAKTQASGQRLELSDILNEVHAVTPIRIYRAGEWLDCGNPDRQAESHVTLLQKREFNELTIDRVLGSITKRSRYQAKFRDEINYMRLLPPDLSVLFPRILDFSLDWDKLSVTMEYYGYPSLAEVFVYEQMDPTLWERVFVHLFQILTGAFMRYRQPMAGDVVFDMYLKKTTKRMRDLKGPPELVAIKDSEKPLRVNGKLCPSLSMIWPQVEADVKKLAANAQGSIIHGDLCFSNILYDLRSGICKFVDPRGSFGDVGLFGDQRYDIAKLYHSVYGLYDFMTNDLFHVSTGDNEAGEGEINLNIRSRPQHQQILDRFEKVFFKSGRYDRREILLITGLIFASIPTLHYDSPPRQTAMFARALLIFSELYPVEPSTQQRPSSSVATAPMVQRS